MKTAYSALALAGLLVASPAYAFDGKGSYTVQRVAGEITCPSFLADYAKANFRVEGRELDGARIAYEAAGQIEVAIGYFAGVMAGVNRSLPPNKNWFPNVGIVDGMAWLASWCRDSCRWTHGTRPFQ
jgi:hypothetical protein